MLDIPDFTKHSDPEVQKMFIEAHHMMEKGCDLDRAKELMHQAADKGCTEAMVCLGVMYVGGNQSEKDQALELFMRAAVAGDPMGARNTGYLYALGLCAPKDKKKAAEWYRKAAELGNAKAQCNLGVLYEYGNGVPQSYKYAAYWYMKSAENGYSRGQTNIGVLLLTGKGLKKDVQAAKHWFSRSKSPRASYYLAKIYLEENEMPKDLDAAMELLENASNRGYAKAMVALARMIESSERERAIQLYNEAASQGDADAIKRLSEMGQPIPKVQRRW